MDENKNYSRQPWEPGKYETGRTRPPKSHNGLIAILLVVVIFLSGLVSFLGVLNVKLFAQLKARNRFPLSVIRRLSPRLSWRTPLSPRRNGQKSRKPIPTPSC